MRVHRKWIILIAVALILATGASVAYVISLPANQDESYEDSLHVSQSDKNEIEGAIIEFEEMTEDQQRIFRSAIGRSESIPAGVDRSVWIDHRGVRYQNETYQVAVAVP